MPDNNYPAPSPIEARRGSRIPGYDIAKTIAMFLVVLLHSSFYVGFIPNTTFTRIAMTLTVTCVPLFFSVNGAILFNKPLDNHKHIHKIANLIALLLSWRAIHIILYWLLGSASLSLTQIVSILLGNTSVEGYLTGHFWFLEALIATYIIFPLLKMAFDASSKLPLALATVTLALLTFGIDGMRSVSEALFGGAGSKISMLLKPLSQLNIFGPFGYLLVYFIVGGIIGSKRKAFDKELSRTTISATICLGVFSAVITGLLHEAQYRACIAGPFATAYGYWLPSTLLTTFSILVFCVAIGNKRHPDIVDRIFQLFGSNTFGVYLLHMFGLLVLAKAQVAGNLIPQGMPPMSSFFLAVAIIILLQVLLTLLTEIFKKAPLIKKLFRF